MTHDLSMTFACMAADAIACGGLGWEIGKTGLCAVVTAAMGAFFGALVAAAGG